MHFAPQTQTLAHEPPTLPPRAPSKPSTRNFKMESRIPSFTEKDVRGFFLRFEPFVRHFDYQEELKKLDLLRMACSNNLDVLASLDDSSLDTFAGAKEYLIEQYDIDSHVDRLRDELDDCLMLPSENVDAFKRRFDKCMRAYTLSLETHNKQAEEHGKIPSLYATEHLKVLKFFDLLNDSCRVKARTRFHSGGTMAEVLKYLRSLEDVQRIEKRRKMAIGMIKPEQAPSHVNSVTTFEANELRTIANRARLDLQRNERLVKQMARMHSDEMSIPHRGIHPSNSLYSDEVSIPHRGVHPSNSLYPDEMSIPHRGIHPANAPSTPPQGTGRLNALRTNHLKSPVDISNTCLWCSSGGHSTRECSSTCSKCGEGHHYSSCPTRLEDLKCDICGGRHTSKVCHWRLLGCPPPIARRLDELKKEKLSKNHRNNSHNNKRQTMPKQGRNRYSPQHHRRRSPSPKRRNSPKRRRRSRSPRRRSRSPRRSTKDKRRTHNEDQSTLKATSSQLASIRALLDAQSLLRKIGNTPTSQ